MIPAIQRAAKAYATQFPGRSFDELVGRALQQGAHVVAFPDLFIIAVPSSLQDGRWTHDDLDPNTWFIVLAATSGSDTFWDYRAPAAVLTAFMGLAPKALPYVAWQRRGSGVRVYPWERLQQMALRKETYGIR
jgi:hypothetical protein